MEIKEELINKQIVIHLISGKVYTGKIIKAQSNDSSITLYDRFDKTVIIDKSAIISLEL